MTDHAVRMQYADDGQPLWSEWEEGDIGDTGQYGLRIVFTRLGSFRNRVIRVTCSSPRRRDLLGAVAILQPTEAP